MSMPPRCSVDDITSILKKCPNWELHVNELPWELVSAMSGNVIITVSKPVALRTKGKIEITECSFNVYHNGKAIHNQELDSKDRKQLVETVRGWMAGGGKGVELRKMLQDMA